MSVRTFDAKKVQVIFNGLSISGFADGTFANVEREEQGFTKVTGADGFTSRSKSNNRSGSVTITLLQTSPSNDVLSNILAQDELNANAVYPLTIKDLSGESLYFTSTAWIQKAPTIQYGKEINSVEWIIDCSDLQMKVAGNAGVGVETAT